MISRGKYINCPQRRSEGASRFHRAVEVFRESGGILRTGQAIRAGIHPTTLYALRDAGVLETMSRGVFRIADEAPLANIDLVIVALRIPSGVVCLISALAFHELTTQIPHAVHVALPPNAERPTVEFPPLRTYRFSAASYAAGVQTHELDRVDVRIFSAEKTLADCFKFRNRLGMDVVLESLRLYRERGNTKIDELLRFASICRVEKAMKPYLEALF